MLRVILGFLNLIVLMEGWFGVRVIGLDPEELVRVVFILGDLFEGQQGQAEF